VKENRFKGLDGYNSRVCWLTGHVVHSDLWFTVAQVLLAVYQRCPANSVSLLCDELLLCCGQVIDLISLKPFDMETISKSIKKTRKALIVEECMKTGGIGASLSAVINESLFDELDHQV
jgi:hypothetical protein